MSFSGGDYFWSQVALGGCGRYVQGVGISSEVGTYPPPPLPSGGNYTYGQQAGSMRSPGMLSSYNMGL